jgi:hypothetical protein
VSSDVVRTAHHVTRLVYLLVFHAYINEMHGSRSKIPSKKLVYIYDVKFLALLGATCIYDISRLRDKDPENSLAFRSK